MNVEKQLPESFYKDNGFECCFCLDAFDTKVSDKKPSMLTCTQHNLCMQCITGEAKLLKQCPECREPITISANPRPNVTMMALIETKMKECLNVNSSPKKPKVEEEKPSAVAPRSMAVPENFSCRSLSLELAEIKSIGDQILTVLPKVVKNMDWKGEAAELQKDFDTCPEQWFVMRDSQNNNTEPNTIAWLKPVDAYKRKWEVHWVGVTEDKTETYIEFYKHLLAKLETDFAGNYQLWNEVSVTAYFNYEKEEKWFQPLLEFLTGHNVRFEILYLHKHWGTQMKFTVYPINKHGHVKKALNRSTNFCLEFNQSRQAMKTELCNHYLERMGLSTLFSMCASNQEYRDIEAHRSFPGNLSTIFSQSPENFFVYTLENRARGFVRFSLEPGDVVKVTHCGMNRESIQYAEHFMQEFVKWARSNPIFHKQFSAKSIQFSLQHALPTDLKKAVKRVKQEL